MTAEMENHKPFHVEHLFGSKTRTRLLSLFVHQPEKKFFVRELARKIEAQLNSVRRELENLVTLGLVEETIAPDEPEVKGRSKEKRKFYHVNTEFTLFPDLRSLLKKVQLLMKKNLVQQIDGKGKVDLLMLTGRFVDNKQVPIDMLIIGEIDEETVKKMLDEFEKEFGHEVNYTVMPKDEYLYRKQVSDRFLFSILNAEHMIMIDRIKTPAKV